MLHVATIVTVFAAAACGSWAVVPLWHSACQSLFRRRLARARQLGIDELRLQAVVTGSPAFAVAALATLSLTGMLPFGVLAFIAAVGLAPKVIDSWIAAQEKRIRDQVPPFCQAMASALDSGLTPIEAFRSVPTAPFAKILRKYEQGCRLQDSLRDIGERLKIDAFSVFAFSFATAIDRGGGLADALRQIQETLGEQQNVEGELEVATAPAQKEQRLLFAFPVAFLALFALLAPAETGLLFSTLPGQLALAFAAGLTLVGAAWAARITAQLDDG